ncbi:uncharacterized protein KGF55_002803 [Candida pseudojiufengensis]|uniref:uncharacterized protein n=1 Tax=Candida pseudojiufengensis TaxID=497109 RepID=UPI0022256B9C|nr:uncharacterized protein KGF55_002803 [Candida pseudojiufengensis]KAI5963011.1 hypothetical protein KGF55_002803 [Candida pseudojiufengensis]
MTNQLIRSVNQLKKRPDYVKSICQLYKELLRKSLKLKNSPSLPKNNIIALTLKVGLYEKFTKRYTNPEKISEVLLNGIRLNNILEEALRTKKWSALQEFIDQEQNENWLLQQRRSSFLKHSKELQEKNINNLRGKEKTLAMSRRRKKKISVSPPKDRHEVSDYVKKGFEKAQMDGQSLILRYLNQLQYDGKIPNPHLLPYTEETFTAAGDNYNQKHIINGASQKIINEAFDQEYIESILIPNLEFELNNLEIERLLKILNEKGPYQATAKQTSAGVVTMPFIETPTHDFIHRPKLAKLIKQQVLWYRIRKIWESSSNLKEENRQKNGGYPVKGSRGFGVDEIIKPRSFYQELAEGEELFELFTEIERRKIKNLNDDTEIDFKKFDWCSDLDFVSEYIDKKLEGYLNEGKSMNLLQLQTKLQNKFNKKYDSKVERFKKLLKQLKEDRVFKHSEIVSLPVTTPLRSNLPKIDKFPIEDRIGRGKKVSDYLKSNKFKHFEFGNQLTKRINEIMTIVAKKY